MPPARVTGTVSGVDHPSRPSHGAEAATTSGVVSPEKLSSPAAWRHALLSQGLDPALKVRSARRGEESAVRIALAPADAADPQRALAAVLRAGAHLGDTAGGGPFVVVRHPRYRSNRDGVLFGDLALDRYHLPRNVTRWGAVLGSTTSLGNWQTNTATFYLGRAREAWAAEGLIAGPERLAADDDRAAAERAVEVAAFVTGAEAPRCRYLTEEGTRCHAKAAVADVAGSAPSWSDWCGACARIDPRHGPAGPSVGHRRNGQDTPAPYPKTPRPIRWSRATSWSSWSSSYSKRSPLTACCANGGCERAATRRILVTTTSGSRRLVLRCTRCEVCVAPVKGASSWTVGTEVTLAGAEAPEQRWAGVESVTVLAPRVAVVARRAARLGALAEWRGVVTYLDADSPLAGALRACFGEAAGHTVELDGRLQLELDAEVTLECAPFGLGLAWCDGPAATAVGQAVADAVGAGYPVWTHRSYSPTMEAVAGGLSCQRYGTGDVSEFAMVADLLDGLDARRLDKASRDRGEMLAALMSSHVEPELTEFLRDTAAELLDLLDTPAGGGGA